MGHESEKPHRVLSLESYIIAMGFYSRKGMVKSSTSCRDMVKRAVKKNMVKNLYRMLKHGRRNLLLEVHGNKKKKLVKSYAKNEQHLPI